MNVLLLTAHDIAEYDDLRMLSDLGYSVFSIGAYTDPAHPASVMRPALPDVPAHPALAALCERQREKHAGEEPEAFVAGEWHHLVDWAKADLHPDLIEWADVVICHHYLESWIVRQWPALRHKRVIWRTCGQSNARLEETMRALRPDGLEIVRYSPAEERAFTRLGTWAGQDTLIRFGKYPEDWGGWTGEDAVVGNVTQNMAGRGEFCGLTFWQQATEGLPVRPAGLQSEALPGGTGALTYDEMREYLRRVRAYLYTGTQPASYTLGLIEAMMTGVPVVSIGPGWMWIPDLFEGHEIVGAAWAGSGHQGWANEPAEAGLTLDDLWRDETASIISRRIREYAIDTFGIATIGDQWREYLGSPTGAKTDLDRIFWEPARA